ncbi:MAG: TetR/AcrR family transcriptional regulator C-terminal domain-containing protein [Actinobacteria bacterium]|nr:TetR/AcrR family transcriptional regulator C-terminal domain-containing protein [Actinomycetota bacterium]
MSSDQRKTHEAEREERAAQRAREKVERAEDRVREHSERAQQQVARALERVAEAEDRAGEKVAEALKRAERADGMAPDEDFEPLVWFRDEPSSRRPAHSRADIARAAVEIADSEGFDAVSMRRVAQRLGAGTMTLYHYVRNKDELITLMSDAVMAEIVVPEEELADDWRAALTQIAIRTRAVFAAHRWIFERMGDGRPGPSGLRHFEQSLQAVAPLGLGRNETFELIGLVDDYVFGYSLREQQELEEHERGWPPEVRDFFRRELESGRYPRISAFFDNDFDSSFNAVLEFLNQPGRFERGLNRLLDGIEAELNPPK